MNINRVWAMPNKWTFQIKPIAELLARYVGDGKGWIDPFAGMTSPAEFTNDLNPDSPAQCHMDAVNFCHHLNSSKYNGILFDPPYSAHQVVEVYNGVGKRKQSSIVMDVLGKNVAEGGYAISFGWNSNGFGRKRGFELIEVLLVAHGAGHNDTIVTVERKIQRGLALEP